MVCCPYNATKKNPKNDQQSALWNHSSDFVGQMENCKERRKQFVRNAMEKQFERQLLLAGNFDFMQTSYFHCY